MNRHQTRSYKNQIEKHASSAMLTRTMGLTTPATSDYDCIRDHNVLYANGNSAVCNLLQTSTFSADLVAYESRPSFPSLVSWLIDRNSLGLSQLTNHNHPILYRFCHFSLSKSVNWISSTCVWCAKYALTTTRTRSVLGWFVEFISLNIIGKCYWWTTNDRARGVRKQAHAIQNIKRISNDSKYAEVHVYTWLYIIIHAQTLHWACICDFVIYRL